MFAQIRTGLLTSLATAATLLVGAQGALANDQDLIATTVPATSCQPANHSLAAKVALSNGAWVFSGANFGTVTFYCPLPLNAFTKSDSTNDNDIRVYRVYYRDTDGMEGFSRVTAQLMFRMTVPVFVGAQFNSNNIDVLGDTKAHHVVVHDMQPEAMYSFIVTLHRANTSQNPAFTGIDFPSPPPQ